MDKKKAIKQLSALKKAGKELRLAADGWDEDWKTLISTALSARTRDDVTIKVSNELYKRYKTVRELATANPTEVAGIIRPVNFFRNKTKSIIACAKALVKEHNGRVPHDFAKLTELPGVGRKTANVFLAEQGHGRIGVDTHVDYITHYLGWTKGKTQKDVEEDLEKLFPSRYWKDINWILVRFGQTYRGRKEKNKILDWVRK
ncbi:MAG: endonuclease III [archaeon]|jgi:endonuclease-3|nr:endonuclease III [archaeon]